MPFAKWNLEPVYVARTTPWTLPTKVVRPSASASAAAAATTSSPINDDHKTAPKLPNISGKLNRIGSKQQQQQQQQRRPPPPPQQYHDNGDTIIINGLGNIDDGGDGETTQTSGAKINGDHHQLKKQPSATPHPSQSPLINGNEDGARSKLDHLKNNGQHPQKEEEDDDDEEEIMFIDGQDNHHHHHHVNDDNGQNIDNVGDDDDGKLSKKFNQNTVKKNADVAIYSFTNVHHPKDLTDDEQILLKIHNRTLVGIIKQMVSLLSSSDQMFQELTDECRRLMDRSGKLRQRFQKLTTGLDRLNHLMRHTAPRIGNIFDYKQLSKEVKHFKSELKLDRSLFTIDTRPLSVRNLYARAHAPGDVRLSCTVFSPFGRQQSVNQNGGQNMQLIMNNGIGQSQQQCQCHCGQCHPLSNGAGDQQKSSNIIATNDNLFKNVMTESEYETSRRSCECCNNDEHNNGISPESNESSSSSSIVTWSSVTSSTFESMGHHHHHHHHQHNHRSTQPSQQSTTTTNTTISQQQSSLKPQPQPQQQQQQQQQQQPQQPQQPNQQSMQNKSIMIKSSKAKIKPMSSFSSSGDYYPNGTKTIDDFFRKNNIVDDPIKQLEQKHQQNPQCRCSCLERQMTTPDARIVELKDPLSTGEKSLHQNGDHHPHRYQQNPQSSIVPPLSLSWQANANGAIYNPDDYWYWWWWWAEDENRRRWSSALTGSSPLKPTILDEMTIWLRENIETRRPERLVIKSASELPKNVMLERALSPPCSSHNITLRKRTEPNGNDFSDGKNGTYPKLKRRWSLLPFRRLSKRWSKRFDHTKRTSLMLVESNESENLPTIKDHHKNNEHSSHENLIDFDDDQDQEEDDDPKEIVLMSPEERSKLLADRFAQFSMVDIDVSGRSFDRLSKTRRSLIHADFQIPRNKIPGQRRSRSKSPHPRSAKLNHGDEQHNQSDGMVSPYALSQLIVKEKQSKMNRTIEKGCQTDTNLLLGGLLNKASASGVSTTTVGNKFMVPIDVHNNDNDFRNDPDNFRKTKTTTTMNEFDARRFMRRDYQDNDNGADGDEDIDDEDNDDEEDDDEYVVILKKHPNVHGHYYHHNHGNQKSNQTRLDDTTSSNASVDMEWMKRLQDGGKPCLASSPMIQMKNPPPMPIASTTSKLSPTAATTATISKATSLVTKQNQESQSNNDPIMNVDDLNMNQKSKQNGARSSSGNWSAATSDLVHSSSSSSSPPLHVLKRHLTNPSKATATTNVDPGTTASAAAAAAVTASIGRRVLNPKSLNIKDQATQQPPLSLSTGSGNTSSNNNGGANEEAESVYSVDNDGYYTSMHTDSGLFFGSNSLPLVHPHQHNHHQHQHHPNQGINCGRNRSNISTFTSQTSLSKRQQQQQQLIDSNRNKIKLNKIKKSEENFRISLLSRWKRFNNSATSSAKNNPEFLQNIDDHDDDDDDDDGDGADNMKQSLLENDLRKSKDQPQYGSNVSINSILSNSDAATSTANMDHVSFGTNSSVVDFDCSVSHCSHQMAPTSSGNHHHHHHQNPNNKDNVMIMMRKMKSNNRMRSVSGGAYDETNPNNNNTLRRSSASNSSETLHTNDYDDELVPETDAAVVTTVNQTKQKCGRSNAEKIQNVNVASKSVGARTKSINCSKRYASLTESSSNSSSCRKLPPPPPPPRVSSMLRTLQKYNSNPGTSRQQQQQQQQRSQQRGSSVSSYAGSDITSGIPTITSQTTASDSQNNVQDANANNGADLSLTSETNSEYLHEKHDERRRRLFLEVDSNRSYPPLSYIYDQTDTATSVSIPSSACFEIEELELDHQHHIVGDTSDGKKYSMLGQNMDSETVDKIDGGKKQLEERHLSSPLPPPKLDSFTFNNNKHPNNKNSGHHHHHHHHNHHNYYHQNHGSSPKLRSKSSNCSSSSSTATTTTITITTTSKNTQQSGGDASSSSKLSSTSSLSSSTIKAPSSPESIPKPKPRNSLILSNSTFSTSHETESTDSKVEDGKRITESQPKQPSSPQQQSGFRDSSKTTTSSTTSKSTSSNTGSGAGRRLTTEDLFIILHNSKKRHNIRADPQIFPAAHHRLATSPNGSSSNGSGTRSPMTSPDQGWKSASPVTNNNAVTGSKTSTTFSTTGYRVPETMKRRSWTTAADSLQKNNNNAQVPRTRQSLALDRLGPVRPTTLNDFKRLLSQVRSTTSTSGGQQGANGGSTSPTSIYVALQQVLKSGSVSQENANNNENRSPSSPRTSSVSSNTENATGSSHVVSSSPPSSGVSSLSPMCSPLSPYRSISSNNSQDGSGSNNKSPMIGSPTSQIKRHNYHNPNQSLPTATVGHHQHQSQPTNQSMNNFMKKFYKSKLLSNAERGGGTSVGSIASGMSRSSTVSARLDVCPPIPEDDSVYTVTAVDVPDTAPVIPTTNKTDSAKSADPKDESIKKDDNNGGNCSGSSKHNCTSTWV